MQPTSPLLALTLLAGLGLAGGAAADEAKAAPDQAFGDWVLHCTRTRTGEEACALHQRIADATHRLKVAAFAISRNPDGKQLRLAAILPLGLDIPAGVSGKAGTTPIVYTIQTCVHRGCLATAEVDDTLLEALRGSGGFTATFKMRAVAEAVTIPISIKGLDEGLKALAAK